MFDPCRFWRGLLSRRIDGTLPRLLRRGLETHLTRCADCRAAQEADDALHGAFGMDADVPMDAEWAQSFNDSVVNLLKTPAAVPPAVALLRGGRRWMRTQWNAMPFGFLKQVFGSALAAACVTALCLSSALRPPPPTRTRTAPTVPAHTAPPPVPLEALLNNPAPRAALLWGTTSPPNKPLPAAFKTAAPPTNAAPTPPKPQPPAAPEKDGALPRRFLLG